MKTAQTRWRILFSGHVQRVGFRYTAVYLARTLGLTGWVRNLQDGRVAVEAQGGIGALRQLVIRLKSQPHIHIERTEILPIDPVSRESGFRVRREGDDK